MRSRRQARRLGRARQGLRVREGPLRRGDEGGLPHGGARKDPDRRHPRLRQGGGDRRSVLRNVVLPRAAEGRRAGLRAAARSHPRHRPGRHRHHRPPRRAAPRGARSRQGRDGADDDAVRRGAGGHQRVSLPRREGRPQAGAGHGANARQEPRGHVGPVAVHRRVPREPDEDHQGEDEGEGSEAHRARRAAAGGSGRPDGAPAPVAPGRGRRRAQDRPEAARRPPAPRRGRRRKPRRSSLLHAC